jgi:hypothetical protein
MSPVSNASRDVPASPRIVAATATANRTVAAA